MMRRFGLILCLLFAAALPVSAQDAPDARPLVVLNLRAGPGTQFAVIGALHFEDGLILEARSADTAWALGHTLDGARRGWVAAIYLTYREGFAFASLPVSDEVIAQAAPPGAGQAPVAAPPSGVISIPARAYDILAYGVSLGNNPRGFIKVGDSNAQSTRLLEFAFESGQYDLGPYAYLQPTIDFYRDGGSFRHFNASAQGGFSILAAQDPMYRDQQYCHEMISPLECDFQYLKPSVVFILPMVGDIYGLTDYQYASGLRQAVEFCIARGAVPVLITMPIHHRVDVINGTLIAVAQEYSVPLIDFASAAAALPNRGVYESDTVHLTGTDFMSFNGDETVYGYALLNLLALQTLDQFRMALE